MHEENDRIYRLHFHKHSDRNPAFHTLPTAEIKVINRTMPSKYTFSGVQSLEINFANNNTYFSTMYI